MDYFMFKRINENLEKRLPFDKEDYNFIFMRYCKKCGSRIWGIWSFRNKRYLDNKFSYSKKTYFVYPLFLGGFIVSNRQCGNPGDWTYDAAKNYKRSSEYKKLLSYRKELEEFLNAKFCPVCASETSYNEVPYIFSEYPLTQETDFKLIQVKSKFSYSKKSLNVETCKIGETLITPLGVGECVKISDDGMCEIKFFDELSFDSIRNYVTNSFKEIYFKPNGKDKFEKFKKENQSETNTKGNQADLPKEDLSKYLLQIIETEKCLYSLSTRLQELYTLDLEYSKLAYASKNL